MTRTLTFTPRIWADLDAGELTLPVARALQMIEDGATIYGAAKATGHDRRTLQRSLMRIPAHQPNSVLDSE